MREDTVVIEDTSAFAKDPRFSLSGYICCTYDEDLLTGRYGYDDRGRATDRILYEYDETGRLLHEKGYEAGILTEEVFYHYLETGYAGVHYTYAVEETQEGAPRWYLESYDCFLCDEDGQELCYLEYDGEDELLGSYFGTYIFTDYGYVCVFRRLAYDGAGRVIGMYDYISEVTEQSYGVDGSGGRVEYLFGTEKDDGLCIVLYDADGAVLEQYDFDKNGIMTDPVSAGSVATAGEETGKGGTEIWQ